ncbi:MAG TPA: ATP-dependent helicase HrpB [Gemmatimonadaceae bacterium]|nr:ATP-dependent helicase HrpB [Gemmatimonadaceae bacterium]
MILPIDSAIPALRAALAARTGAVLQAPPGAGKTTRVPLALLDEPWLRAAGGRLVMLEPRRLATRAAARFMAATLGERVGETVGYRVRNDTRVGPATRLEVVTEGVLTRMLQHDAALEGVGLVIFDEFHERNLHGALGLALALQSRALLRDDLRLLVMSATLDGAPVAALMADDLGPAPIVTSEGRAFPVETRFVEPPRGARVDAAVAMAVRRALAADEGDVLAFLPGAGEIRRAESMLRDGGLPDTVDVYPLYGDLPPEVQDAAVRPSVRGRRKVVLATSIAETSLTIDGVRVVVDGGVARVPRFSPRRGLTRLETVRVSRASADQRRGRAGRTAPGVCYRLWGEHEQQALLPRATPEILEADLAPLALELAEAGVADPSALRWLDPPPAASLAHARELLTLLGALDDSGRVTAHGRRMATLGVHPRLAHMLQASRDLGLAALACDVAALLDERDILRADGGGGGGDMGRGRGEVDADLRLRLEALRGDTAVVQGYTVDRDGRRRVREAALHLRQRLGVPRTEPALRDAGDADSCGLLLAFAYPDRIAQRRAGDGGRFLLRNGGGAGFPSPQPLASSAYVVAAELDGQARESRIFLAAPITIEEIEEHFGDQAERETVVEYDAEVEAVRARERRRLGALVLRDAPLRDPDPELVAAALLDAALALGLDRALAWGDGARRVQQRVGFLRTLDPSRWPDLSDAALAASARDWLAPHVAGARRLADLRQLDVAALLLDALGWERRAALDELAPTHVTVPSGSRIPVDYAEPAAPVLAVRLQELFGLTETPRVGRGAVPLTLHLLSPAHRPVQVTRDLAGFWRTSYFEVRRELKGRYPKHHWPDDPLAAPATSRAKRRGE